MSASRVSIERNALAGALVLSAICVCRAMPTTDGRCTNILEQALLDRNPDTRKQAVVALSLVGSLEPFFSRLDGMLQDTDVEVRLAAIASLGEAKSDKAVASLRRSLDDEVPEVRFAAAKVLWRLHDPAGRRTLISVLGGETKASSSVLSQQKRDAVRMVHTPRRMLMSALRYGVGFAPVPGIGEGVASMQALLTDPGVSSRATAALMLSKDNDPATLEALRAALSDKDWTVRAAAVHALALRSDPRLQQDLMPLLDDSSEAVRLRAAAGCLRLSYFRVSGSRRSPEPS